MDLNYFYSFHLKFAYLNQGCDIFLIVLFPGYPQEGGGLHQEEPRAEHVGGKNRGHSQLKRHEQRYLKGHC